MKVLLTMPISALTGAMSRPTGLVAFSWRGLTVLRSFVRPTNPDSAAQQAIRNILTQCAQAYQSVTPTERAAWAAYCAANPVTIMGQSVILPEISMYVRVNAYRLIDGQAISDAAPTVMADFVASDIASRAYVAGTTTLSFVVTHNADPVTGRLWLIKTTGSLASQMVRVKDNDYRLADGVATGSIVPVTATPQTIEIITPTFANWSNGDYMDIQLVPLSAEYDPGTKYHSTDTIAVS